MTNKELREQIGNRDGVEKVKITHAGEVHCFGWMARGDGGKRPWWMFVGMVEDLKRQAN